MTVPSRARLRALARAFDHAAAPGLAPERRLKARLARRRARGRRYLTAAELRWLGEWKTPRIRPRIARNRDPVVRAVTEAAFLTRDERRRMGVLLALHGVGVPVASVVLHFAEPARYPVYDVRVRRALRRLGVRGRFPPTPDGWVAFVACLRRWARRRGVTLRTLDKALWWLGG